MMILNIYVSASLQIFYQTSMCTGKTQVSAPIESQQKVSPAWPSACSLFFILGLYRIDILTQPTKHLFTLEHTEILRKGSITM